MSDQKTDKTNKENVPPLHDNKAEQNSHKKKDENASTSQGKSVDDSNPHHNVNDVKEDATTDTTSKQQNIPIRFDETAENVEQKQVDDQNDEKGWIQVSIDDATEQQQHDSDKLNSQIAKSEQKLNDKEDKEQEWKGKYETLELEKKKLNSKFAQLENNYATLTENHAQLEIQNKSSQIKLLNQQKQYKSLEQKWVQDQKYKREKEKQVDKYAKDNAQLEIKNKSLTSKRDKLQIKLQNQQNQYNLLEEKWVEQQEYKQQKEEQLAKFIKDHGVLNDKMNEQIQELQRQKQQYDELNESFQTQKQSLNKLDNSRKQQAEKLDENEEAIQLLQTNETCLTKQLNTKEQVIKGNKYTFCAILSLLIIVIAVLLDDRNTKLYEIKSSNNQLTNYIATTNEVVNIDKRLNGVIKDLKSKLNVKVEDYIILNQKHEILQNDNNELKERNKKSIYELNNDINNKNSKYEKLYDENERCGERVKRLETNEIELTKKLDQYKNDKEFCELQRAQQKKLIGKLQT